MIHLRVAKGCQLTANILAQLLAKEGVKPWQGQGGGNNGVVCWGAGNPHAGPHILNANCSAFNKLTQLQKLTASGILTVPIVGQVPSWMNGHNPIFPVLARKLNHVAGRDIILCRSPKGCRKALVRGRAYFTQFIPSSTEYRVWVYRKRHLGTYEKFLKYPWKKKGVNRNYHNGYAFQLVGANAIPRPAVDVAVRCIAALGLDFGAVDILLGNDKKFYVLEVNSAPGVEGEGRQAIQLLAHRIARWEQTGYPAKAEDKNAE
jgi:glutathione synthase/RimK-type ligase-like ATP-grasp enzyme